VTVIVEYSDALSVQQSTAATRYRSADAMAHESRVLHLDFL
jgi:hypothetical protein